MNSLKIKAGLIIFGIIILLFLPIMIFSGVGSDKEDKTNFPEYSNLKIKEKDVNNQSSENYKTIKERLENDYLFGKEALISNYDYSNYTSADLKKMLWNYLFAFELNNKKYLSSINYDKGEFCLKKKYVIDSFEELYGVNISNDLTYFDGYYEYVKSKESRYCFNFGNVSRDYNNEIKLLVEGIGVKDNVVSASIYLFEYYITNTPSETENVNELKKYISSTNVLNATNLVKEKLNGKVTHKQIQFIINNGGKFFKYQILNSKNLDY